MCQLCRLAALANRRTHSLSGWSSLSPYLHDPSSSPAPSTVQRGSRLQQKAKPPSSYANHLLTGGK